jgi:CheY-like chemotaxis protein
MGEEPGFPTMNRAARLAQRANSNCPRVLVVHEDPAFTCAVRRLLAETGYSVIECNERDEALLGVVRGEHYDLILYDLIGGPDEATGFVREVAIMNSELAARIAFLSFDEAPESLQELWLTKPLNASDLREWVTGFVAVRAPASEDSADVAETTLTVSREAIIENALVATLRTLHGAKRTRRVRELQAQARSFDAAVKRWATVPPGPDKVTAMLDLVTELHEQAILAAKGDDP